jgi:hypothetical protein
MLDLAGENGAALIEVRRAMELDSTSPPTLFFAVQIHRNAARVGEARELAERLYRRVPTWRSAAAGLLVTLGDSVRMRQIVEETVALGNGHTVRQAYSLTLPYLLLGDTARALTELEHAADARKNFPTEYSLGELEFDRIRASKRFADVVRRIGLDPRVFTSPTGGRPR